MSNPTTLASAILLMLLATPAVAQSALPDPTRTPGAINPEVTDRTIEATICVRGWTRSIRPPRPYTSKLKRQQVRQLQYPDQSLADYSEDHLIPLELGGAPYDPRNLWPEPRQSPDGWNADLKDQLEANLNKRVCSGQIRLQEAQHAIATNWIEAYNRFVIGE